MQTKTTTRQIIYPDFRNLGLVNQYLLPQCAPSQYKCIMITAKCNLPLCINIATFNNDCTFNNSTVTAEQTGNCANIVGPTPTLQLVQLLVQHQPLVQPITNTPILTPYPTTITGPPPSTRDYILLGVLILFMVLLVVSAVLMIRRRSQQA